MARRLELHALTPGRLAVWTGVAVAACLAAGTRADPVVAERTAREIESSLADASFTRMLDDVVRVKGIAERIRLRGAELCAQDLAPVVGVVVTDVNELPWALHEPAHDRFGVDRHVRVLWVAPGFAADRAGIAPGDAIVSVNGVRMLDADQFRAILPDGTAALSFLVDRDGELLRIAVDHDPGCASVVDVNIDSEINAWADGENVVVTTGFLRHFPDDDQLALVIGHELAHNRLDHVKSRNGRYDEADADYLGAYFAARAGYDVGDAEVVFVELGMLHFYASGPNARRSHPTSPARVLALRETVDEIEAKNLEGTALAPEYWE